MDVTLIPVPKAAGDEFALGGGYCLIGRARDCDLQLASCLVSRHHAELFTEDDSLRLRDLNSLNGTFVNGEQLVNECVLVDGDVVAFGMAAFEVRIVRRLGDCTPRGPAGAPVADRSAAPVTSQ